MSLLLQNPPSATSSMSAYDRHKELISKYLYYHGEDSVPILPPVRTERDIIIENHEFIRKDDSDDSDHTAGEDKAKVRAYYDQLIKEFALVDLSRYKSKQIALRWRTQAEVLEGKGQFACGSLSCADTRSLKPLEVDFKFEEAGDTKRALVKVMLCPPCRARLRRAKGT